MTKLLLIVTGASRGLGRAIAKAFCEASSPTAMDEEVRAILVARSESGLNETAESITSQAAAASHADVSVFVTDLADLDHLDENFDKILLEQVVSDEEESFDRLVFINNAGSLGYVGPCTDTPSLQDMKRAIDFNVTSALWASVRMARFAAASKIPTTTIVNISSLVAVQPFPTLAIYSAGKAARDSYHAAMASELKSNNNVKILNYAPGPLETDMSVQLRSTEALDDELKPSFAKKLVDPADSAAVLVKLVQENKFESGQHVDYYDVQAQNE